MNKKFTKLIAAIALLVFMAPSLAGWGQTRDVETFTFSELGYGNGENVTTVEGDNVTLTFDAGSNMSNSPKYYNTGSGVRMYSGNTLEVALNDQTGDTRITAIDFTFSGSSYTGGLQNWTGRETSHTFTATGTARIQVIAVTFSDGGTPTPTTYTVTYDCNGGTIGCPSNLTGVEAGTTITLADAPTKDGFDFDGWSDGTTTYDAGDEYTVNSHVTFTAQWTAQSTGGDDHWVLTELPDLTSEDVFVIVGNNGSNYAMSNDNGTDPAPSAVAVTVTGNEITSTVAANIQWNISGDAINGYTFYPNGSTTTWLYCTNTNNGVRVGTNANKTFVVDHDYLKHTSTSRYVGIYNSQDWRCYTSYTATNIAGQTFAFYKKVTGSVSPSITANNVEIAYDATSGSIAYTINNEPTPAGTLTAAVVSGATISNLSLGTPSNGTIAFTCDANDATTARTATVTLTYTYDNDQTVTKDVTVTQAAAPVIYTTIPDIFDAATSTSTNVNVTFGNWVVSGVNGSNAFVTDNSGNGFIIYTSNHGFVVNDKLSGTVMGTPLKLYKGSAEFTNLSSTTDGLTVSNDGSITVITDKTIANLGGVNTGAVITLSNLTYDGTNLSDGTNTIKPYNTLYSGMSFTSGKIYNVTGVYQQYDNTKEILPRSVDDIEEVVSAEPSVTVTPATINAPFAGADGTLAITYENIPDLISFDYYFCDANGTELEETDPNYPDDWIYAEINDENDVYSLGYLIDANDGEARTAYIKVYTTDVPGNEEVYAIVTVNQAQYVVDYATLPFEWDGGTKDELTALNGVSGHGLGSDYAETNAPYRVKFDTDGDYILIKTDQRPGVVSFGIKKLGGAGDSSITIEGSSDGETFTAIETFANEGNANAVLLHETSVAFGANDRYVRIYFNKPEGGSNVGVGPIWIYTYVAPTPTITVESTTISATAEETEGTLNVTYTAIETSLGASVYWYTDNTGTTATDEPGWISADVNETTLNVDYMIEENNGEARTAYFKVYGIDAEFNDVYSELVTVAQAAAPQQYTLTVEPFENLEIITFVNNDMVMEEDGTISVTAGAQVMLSIVADEGFVMETLMVNGVNHVNDIDGEFTYTFEMPGEAVTISATAVEQVAPAGGDYVRITSLNQLTDGSIVVIAARYDEEHTNGYYAMSNATSGKPTGVLFTSTTSGDNEILPASIVDNEDNYYWTVNETENGFTLTNAEGFVIGYNSSTNFATGGNNTEWTIASYTASSTSMVPNYAGFKIVNFNQNGRAFALNESHNYGPYATSNMNGTDAYKYNFCLDFFVQQSETPATNQYTLTINAHNENSGWYLIASPLAGDENGFIEANSVANLVNDDDNDGFDLYQFNQNPVVVDGIGKEWENWKQEGEHKHFRLQSGRGYLYANAATVTLTFTGDPYDGDGTVTLSKTSDADFEGWNLVGNPFAEDAYIDKSFYTMNEGRTGLIAEPTSDVIHAMEGVFVIAVEDGESLTFTTNEPNKGANLALNVSHNRGSVIDRAILSFGEGGALPKFMLNEDHTKVYIPQYGKDYAVVNADNQGEMPVNFRADENGQYTFTVNPEGVEMNYLHLIDNMTGADIDLLQTPSYTFNAKTTDYESRFKLVYCTGTNDSDDSFAFFSNGQLIVNNDGEATLQVIDITGRILSNERINGSVSTQVNASTGVYMLRLINGEDVKVQKVVVR